MAGIENGNDGMTKNKRPNMLYFGDNLEVLRRHVSDESVDLVYLDPPFNSNADYNVLFAQEFYDGVWFFHVLVLFAKACSIPHQVITTVGEGFV